MPLPETFYATAREAHRRERLGAFSAFAAFASLADDPAALRDGDPIPERWIQQVWRHQRLRQDELRLADGTALRVWHPGFWNREAGPDFQGAVIQFGDAPPRTGDVELDLVTAGWRHHGHARNPTYTGVILHVVWDEADVDRARPPVMALKPYLDAPWAELTPWLDLEAPRTLPDNVPGQCSGPLRSAGVGRVTELLRQAARVRLEAKAAELAARARQRGWNGAVWEGLLGALGYKNNAWPFRRLAWVAMEPGVDPAAESISPAAALPIEARLLGLAGLLPVDLPRGADPHLRSLWDCWWREREALAEQILPSTMWRLSGTRPANRPERRLALAARWLLRPTLAADLEAWLTQTAGLTTGRAAQQLLELLSPAEAEHVPFWSNHWTLRSPALAEPHVLLGAPRVTDLAMNVILPWLWARSAAASPRPELRALVEQRWTEWPGGEDNAVLRLTRQRLFGNTPPRLPRRAEIQQGMLQITRDFCQNAGALCTACRLPSLVSSGSLER